jgi:hypothetical protein
MYTTRENMKQGVQRAQQQKEARSIEEGLNLQVKEAYSNAKLSLLWPGEEVADARKDVIESSKLWERVQYWKSSALKVH